MKAVYPMCFILAVFFNSIEVNSQLSPERARNAARLSPPRSLPPTSTNVLPRGLRLMGPNGTFYPFERNANLVGTSDGSIIGIRDAYGFLRPIFFHRTMVKVTSGQTRAHRTVSPLTLREYVYYNYNSDITIGPDRFVQYISELRGRNNFG